MEVTVLSKEVDRIGVMFGYYYCSVLVWKIKDTYKASFDIAAEQENFVMVQSDEAIEKWAADEFRSTNGQIQWILDQA